MCGEPLAPPGLPIPAALTPHLASTGGRVGGTAGSPEPLTEVSTSLKFPLQGECGVGHGEGPKPKGGPWSASSPRPPRLPVTLSYYSPSWAENSSLKRIIFVSVKRQSWITEKPGCRSVFQDRRSAGKSGASGSKGEAVGGGVPPLPPGAAMAFFPRSLPIRLADQRPLQLTVRSLPSRLECSSLTAPLID